MSTDSFHHKVEKKKAIKQVCNWNDFLDCIQKAGCANQMKVEDSKFFVNGLSQGKMSKKKNKTNAWLHLCS